MDPMSVSLLPAPLSRPTAPPKHLPLWNRCRRPLLPLLSPSLPPVSAPTIVLPRCPSSLQTHPLSLLPSDVLALGHGPPLRRRPSPSPGAQPLRPRSRLPRPSSPHTRPATAEHPKLKVFLRQVGLPELSRADLTRGHLEACFAEARVDVVACVREACFFQLTVDGWGDQVVTLAVNLPNVTSVFHHAVPMLAPPSSDYAEVVPLDVVSSVAASADLHHCAGIVADRFGSKALCDLESKHSWMASPYWKEFTSFGVFSSKPSNSERAHVKQ